MEKQFNDPAFYFQWHFIESCNMRCKHCYQSGYKYKADLGLIDETISQIDRFLNVWNMSGRVSLTGGEPLLDLGVLWHIAEKLSSMPRIKHIGILTNGTLITDEVISRIKSFPKIKEVQVSLDGATARTHDFIRGKGNFELAVNGLKKLVSAGINSSIMFTVSKLNKDESVAIIDLAEEIGADSMTVERYTPVRGADDPMALDAGETRSIFESVFRKKSLLIQSGARLRIRTSRPLWNLVSDECGGICPVGYSCLTIMHDGTLYPCRRLPIALGNIRADGIFKVWYTSPVLRNLRNRAKIKKCAECGRNKSCDGCRAAAYAVYHDYMECDPLCWKEN